jgi:hypothetical protein
MSEPHERQCEPGAMDPFEFHARNGHASVDERVADINEPGGDRTLIGCHVSRHPTVGTDIVVQRKLSPDRNV